MKRPLIIDTHSSSCYFRTSVGGDGRKASIQITERCNLHCAHCFVSSGDWGEHMRFEDIVERVLPRLRRARVERITLTGGEPFVHPAIMDICQAIADLDMPLGVCTNATQTSDEQIARLKALGNVHVNVSFDGFRPESHGKFRAASPRSRSPLRRRASSPRLGSCRACCPPRTGSPRSGNSWRCASSPWRLGPSTC